MKRLEFKSGTAQKIYDQYLSRVKKSSKILSGEDKNEIMLEINSHIYEGMQVNPDGEEADKLLGLLDSLGDPEDFLKPQVAEKKLKQATTTFNPVHVFQALLLNIRNGVGFILVGLIYLFIFSFIWVFFAKLITPEKVGMFFDETGFVALGAMDNPTGNEVLGYWILPLCLVVMVVLYLLNTLILKYISK